MKDENVYYMAASPKRINKTHSVTLVVFLSIQDLFPYSMSFGKELISSLMTNSNINDKKSAY